jgi:hypothetical protein
MKVSKEVEYKNSVVTMHLMTKNGGEEVIKCAKISYYVDDNLIVQGSGEIMINRRDNYPKIHIKQPDTGDYTEDFQENSCIFSELDDGIVRIETKYVPKFLGHEINVKVIIVTC